MRDYRTLFANVCSPSTHRRVQSATLRRNTQAEKSRYSRPKAVHSVPFRYRGRGEALQVAAHYVGGAEAWVRFSCAGGSVDVPGHICVLDALARLSMLP